MSEQTLAFLKGKLPIILAALLLIPIYSLPVWWVSLTAPNYPVEAFPDGVKIHFHLNGVFNGCESIEKDEISEDVTLDCVHEMDTINHYVGMYPIASGGAIENSFSIFLLCMLGVMLLSYLIDDGNKRAIAMAAGFLFIAVWMSLALFKTDGLKFHNAKYLSSRVTALGQEGDLDDAPMSAGESLIASLRASLEGSGVEVEEAEVLTQKQKDISFLEDAFDSNQESLGTDDEWWGTGIQLLSWHYRTSLGRYFNDPAQIDPMVKGMTLAAHVVFWGILVIMVGLVITARKTGGLVHKLLVLVPISLPGLFVLAYSTWLGWYGHRMNDMGAFTLKAFMPTVFGQGKVAQFTTNSYPHIGFFLMLLFSGLLAYSFFFGSKEKSEN